MLVSLGALVALPVCAMQLTLPEDEAAAYTRCFVATKPTYGGIAYFDTKPDASVDHPTILFIHANSLDKRAFTYQLGAEDLTSYRLISVDLPGHGESFRALHPERTYNLDGYSDAVLDLISHLGLKNYVLAGWSLGGHTAMDMYAKLRQQGNEAQLRGLALTGSPPAQMTPENLKRIYQDSEGADPEFMKIWTTVQMTDEQARLFASLAGYNGSEEQEFMLDATLLTDGRARLYIVQSQHDIDARALMEQTDLPVLVIAGGADKGINNDYVINTVKYGNLWSGQVHVLEGIGHGVPVEAPEQYNALLQKFAQEVFEEQV